VGIGLAVSAPDAISRAAHDTAPPKVGALPALTLTLRGAPPAAVDRNPDVQLYRERINAAEGQVLTQFGAMLPNLSSTVRQTRQMQFLRTFRARPAR